MTVEVQGDMRLWMTSGDGVEALQPMSVSIPQPGPTEVLIKVSALSLNYRDILVITGRDGWKPLSPVVPVSDAAGRVVSVGARVQRFRVGDRLLPAYLPKWQTGALTEETYVSPVGGPQNRGFLSEYAVVDEQEAVHAPVHLDDPQAATLPVAGITAWHALRRTALASGETVLIHGTGGVALFALQIAHALGAKTIITSSDDAKLMRARNLGADEVVNYRSEDVVSAVQRITAGRGVEVVVETIGGANLNVSLGASRLGARIAFVGLIGGLSASVDTYRFVQRHVTIHGIESGSRQMLEDLISFVEEHALIPVIDSAFPAARIREALAHLERAGHFGKIVLTEP